MNTIFLMALLILLIVVAIIAFAFAITLLRVGPSHWKEASNLSGSLDRVLSGSVETDRDGLRDPRVAKGKAWNKATKQWEAQGKLSDDYIRNLVS